MRDPAHVDADRRQDPAGAEPVDEPLLAHDAVRHRAGADHVADSPTDARAFEIDFDFIDHRLVAPVDDGGTRGFPLAAADRSRTFYARLMDELAELGLRVEIHKRPNEVADTHPVRRGRGASRVRPRSTRNASGGSLVQADRVLQRFRARFIGKCSPVHFFWGASDLAVTRFSGRPRPRAPRAASRTCPTGSRARRTRTRSSSCGFWPGGGPVPYAAFYAYAYPEPAGFAEAPVRPEGAFYSQDLREFILPYDAVRRSADPDATLLEFLQATYEAAARLGGWDRAALEA